MVRYVRSSIFDSPAQTLVNTVNTIGIMGKGIAKQFKFRFPDMFDEYQQLCKSGALSIGRLHVWRGEKNWVLNFPTKTTWRKPSSLDYVEKGLIKFVSTHEQLGITSASFPPLGCGNGNLHWDEVRPMMEHYLRKVNVPIYIHNVQVGESFVPEHMGHEVPDSFEDFTQHLRVVLGAGSECFQTSASRCFNAAVDEHNNITVKLDSGRAEKISHEMIEEVWVRLQSSLLDLESFPDARSRKLKSYLFPILGKLPYMRTVNVARSDNQLNSSTALFMERASRPPAKSTEGTSERQPWLFQ